MPSPDKESAATRWLCRQPFFVLAVWAMAAAFVAYGCMYAFRKPFTAAAFAGSFGGMDYKAAAGAGATGRVYRFEIPRHQIRL